MKKLFKIKSIKPNLSGYENMDKKQMRKIIGGNQSSVQDESRSFNSIIR